MKPNFTNIMGFITCDLIWVPRFSDKDERLKYLTPLHENGWN